MKKLYKKISVGVAIGVLLIGGVFSQGAIAYASLPKLESRYELYEPIPVSSLFWDELKFSDPYVRKGSEVFGYKILHRWKIKRSASYYLKRVKLKGFSKCFRNGIGFISHLYEKGIKKGIYDFWIGGWHYRIKFEKDIQPLQPWDWWNGFPNVKWL